MKLFCETRQRVWELTLNTLGLNMLLFDLLSYGDFCLSSCNHSNHRGEKNKSHAANLIAKSVTVWYCLRWNIIFFPLFPCFLCLYFLLCFCFLNFLDDIFLLRWCAFQPCVQDKKWEMIKKQNNPYNLLFIYLFPSLYFYTLYSWTVFLYSTVPGLLHSNPL